MNQEREPVQIESTDVIQCELNENVSGVSSLIRRTETILPSPFFSAVIALTCACVLLIM